MISDEMERNLITMYAESINNYPIQKSWFVQINNPQESAVYLANGYTTWIEASCNTKNDKYLLMLLNFMHIMNLYRQFSISFHVGDASAIEWLYK